MAKKPKKKDVDPFLLNYVLEGIEAQSKSMTNEERTRTVEQIRAHRQRQTEREETELRDAMETIMSVAEKATGLSREAMIEMAKRLETERRPVVRRTPRELASARGVPEKHLRGVTDREPIDCDALVKVREFLAAEQQLFLVLAGPVGVRKSGSACYALTKTEGRYVLAADLPTLALDKERKDEWARVRSTPLLVIDELSLEYTDDKGFFQQVFGRLIQERYVACNKTLITYNLGAAAFKERYGERVADRINEDGVFFETGGTSVRGHVEHWSNRERDEDDNAA